MSRKGGDAGGVGAYSYAVITQILTDFLLILLPLFVVIDPAGTLPLFLALTARKSEDRRRDIARRATLVAGIVGIVFVTAGQGLFTLMGVHFADFQIAGGILLVILCVLDLLSSSKPAVDETNLKRADAEGDSISVVPLAVPLIVGPATMTTSLLLVSTYSPRYSQATFAGGAGFGPQLGPVIVIVMVCLALVINLLGLYVAMRHAGALERIIGKNVMLVINKIVMILLAAIAVSLIRQGVTSIVMDLPLRR